MSDSRSLETHSLRRPVRLGDEVYEFVLNQLMSLAIAPDARISVDDLARKLGVSQTPIREALSRLEAEGLVQKTHLVGYRAAPQLSRKQFEDLYELRLLLEPHVCGLAALSITEEGLSALLELEARMSVKSSKHAGVAYSEFAELDRQFHDIIAQASGNELIEDALARLYTHVHLFRLMYSSRVTKEALGEHAAIIAALRARDTKAAASAMRRHIERSRHRFASIFIDHQSNVVVLP